MCDAEIIASDEAASGKAGATLSDQVQSMHRRLGLISAALVDLQGAAERADAERAACRCGKGQRAARSA